MNCPYCNRYFALKQQAIDHINRNHNIQLEADQMDAAQALYFSTHHTLHGICMCGCGKPTEWNYHTGKPYKVRNDPKCIARLNKKAKENMVKVYGKETLLNDMKHQEEMQRNRHTYGEYTFQDGGKVGYLSELEKNFLQFCDVVMEFTSNMIQDSPEVFTYFDPHDQKNHQYIPDKYLPDYNLLVEIKDGGTHPNTNPAFVKETKYKVALKDTAMKKQERYNYIRISGKQYGPFVELLYQITHQDIPEKPKQTAKNFIVITEAACKDPDTDQDFTDVNSEVFHSLYIFTVYDKFTNQLIAMGGKSTAHMDRVYLYNMLSNRFQEASDQSEIFQNTYVREYQYIGNVDDLNTFLHMLIHMVLFSEESNGIDLLELMTSNHINFDDKMGTTNNDSHMSDFIYIRTWNMDQYEES